MNIISDFSISLSFSFIMLAFMYISKNLNKIERDRQQSDAFKWVKYKLFYGWEGKRVVVVDTDNPHKKN